MAASRMVATKPDYGQPFKETFKSLDEDQRWTLKAEGEIIDAMYRQSPDGVDDPAVRRRDTAPNDRKQRKVLDDIKKAVENEASATNKEFFRLQEATKQVADKFYKQEDFLRHLEFGKEFDDAPKYNSRRKESDSLGFEYSVPPREKSIQAKLLGKYNSWLAKEKELEEEEELIKHEMTGSDAPFRIEDLQYDVPYVDNESYENYYGGIKELRQMERRYKGRIDNVADSALIVDGNVAFGKATEGPDGNPDFERKLSTNSLEDMDGGIVIGGKHSKRKVFSTIAKRMRRKRSPSGDDNASAHSNDTSSQHGGRAKSNDESPMNSLKRKIKLTRDTIRKRMG